MSRIQQIIVGWGMVIGAIGIATLAFPSISEKAADQREQAYWQDRAAAFQAVENGEVYTSSFLQRLTDLHTDKAILNSDMRDLHALRDLDNVNRSDVLKAKHQAREHQCLSEAIYYEARSERVAGQIAVAEVIVNRVNSKHFPNSFCGVVYQGAERNTGCQFTFTCDGSTALQPKGRHWKRSQKIANLTLMGASRPLTERATHYHTLDVNPHWAPSLQVTKTIGSHKFYRFKWRERPVPSIGTMAPPSP